MPVSTGDEHGLSGMLNKLDLERSELGSRNLENRNFRTATSSHATSQLLKKSVLLTEEEIKLKVLAEPYRRCQLDRFPGLSHKKNHSLYKSRVQSC